MSTGIKKLIENQSHQVHSRVVIFAIACSVLLHWAVAQWIAIAIRTSQLPAMGLPRTAIEAIISPPEHTLENPDVRSENALLNRSTNDNLTEIPAESELESIPGPLNLIKNQIKYFRSNEVDVAAIPVFTPPLLFPERAFISKLSGKVRVRVFINEAGTVDSVDALETIPPHQPFTESAIASVQNTIFSPAIIQGLRVKSQKLIEVIFNADEDNLKD